MNRFEKFLGTEKRIEIEGLTFIIKPLKVKDFGLVVDFENPNKRPEAIKKILERIARDSFQDLTAEELSSISEWTVDKTNKIMEAFEVQTKVEQSVKVIIKP